uniref:Trans-AT polyketide synthase n=1 Tax=uncultured bacterium psy1 TaxID=693111 RepID=D2SUD6_9BACT|nr:trans-AT polyketide synthase [uncultured bacterium psy1]
MKDVKKLENATLLMEQYARAYTAGSAVLAAKRVGLLDLLASQKRVARSELQACCEGREFLDPCLEALHATGYLRSIGEQYVTLAMGGHIGDCPKEAAKLYDLNPVDWVQKPKLQRVMAAWLMSRDDWLSAATRFCLLLAVAVEQSAHAFKAWEKPLRKAFVAMCEQEGWGVKKGTSFSFTPLGHQLLDAAKKYVPFIEIGPHLAQWDRLMQGEGREVAAGRRLGAARRSASWFNPADEAFKAAVLCYFAETDQDHPRYLLHVDGDGEVLSDLYRLIETKVPEAASIELLACCPDAANAEMARKHLKPLPHRVWVDGDEAPAALLAAQGVDAQQVLFVGSPSARWAQVLDDHPFGLVALQYHGLSAGWGEAPETLSAWRIAATLMGQRDAESALMAAARIGLFPRQQPRTFSDETGACHASVTHFVVRPYQMRYVQIEDLAALDRLEALCWDTAIRTPRTGLEARLRNHPQDHVVLTAEGAVVGVIYSQRLAQVDALQGACAADVSERRHAGGPVVQLLAVNIDPASQARRWGDELLEFMLQRCALLTGVHTVVGVTLCQRFHRQALPMETYIHARTEDGGLVDPVLWFHELHGAQIIRPMPGYRPADQLNQGYGVLVHYGLATRQRRDGGTRSVNPTEPVIHGDFSPHLERLVRSLLLDETAFAWDRPLMEMGLDSADLLQLGERVASAFGVSPDPAFFFTHNTCKKILATLAPSTKGREVIVDQSARAEKGVAIVGMACRLPGGITTPEALWTVLAEGRDVVGTVPAGRWVWPQETGPEHGDPGIDCGGFLDDIARFDAKLFRISPREAKVMDPQQRLLLELAWSAFEDAGYSKDAVEGTKTGVFVGASGSDYRLLLEQHRVNIEPVMGTGTAVAVLPNRISYFFDLQGPSLLIDTACSSSLVAIHEAVQALRAGSCEQALVGGINIMCHPAMTLAYYKAGMLSPDGRCKTFDAEANGYVRSEGAIVMMLKPLSAAQRDGDRIYAVVKGSACNHGGQAGGLTVPNPQQQTALLRAAWASARVTPDQLGYLEAHGTGTSLGDPIEVKGMQDAFRADDNIAAATTCYLGSVKSNLGHLEAAAGIAGLMKLALCLYHRQLVSSLHVHTVNPKLGLEQTPFQIAQQVMAWPTLKSGQPSLTGVSSFGSGGTNAHVVVEGVEQVGPARAERPVVIRLSAPNVEQLAIYARCLRDYLQGLPERARPPLSALAYTLSRRQPMAVSASYWARDEASLVSGLADIAAGLVTSVEEERGLSFGEGPVIALPGYPFAETSFWFDKPEAQAAPARPAKVALEDPVVIARRGLGIVSDVLTRSRASHGELLEEDRGLDFADEGDGLWVVTIGASTANVEQLLGELQSGVASLAANPDAKVVLFADLERLVDRFSSAAVIGAVLDGVEELWAANPLVLLAAVQHVPGQVGKRLAKAIDLMVCAEEVAGRIRGDDIGPVRVVPMPDVMKVARALGRQLTAKPRRSLSLLKSQLDRQAASGLGMETSWAAALPSNASDPSISLERRRVALETDVVTVDVDDDGVVWVTLCDRASKNSFSEAFLDGMCEAFDHIRAQEAYKVVVLAGFDHYFCCGGTKEGLLSIQQGQVQFTDFKVFSLPLQCELPVIAAMQGHAIGAGWSLGLFCDVTIMAEERVYEAPYMRYGFTPGAGSTLVFPARLGFDLAGEILFTGESYRGAELRDRGIAWPVLPAGEVETYALQVAREWARRPREVLMAEKAARCTPLRDRLADTLAQELSMHEATFVGRDDIAAAIEASFSEQLVSAETMVSQPTVPQSVNDVSSALYKLLRETLARELHMAVEDIDDDRPFLDMGLDSVIGVTWVRKLNERFGLSITVTKVYAHPTVCAMGHFLLQEESVRKALADAGEPSRVEMAASIVEVKTSDDAPISDVEGDMPAIAVIGMSGQFPQANNVEALWQNLVEGRDCISEVPLDRWPVDAYFDPTPQVPGKTYSRWMGVLEDADKFDPLFFSISPREAMAMDPQQRLFLETCWSCVEDAGYAPSSLSGTRCGVFAGCGVSDYNQHLDADGLDAQRFMGGSTSILAARISYELNLRGPSMAVDTACSASLVAIAVACDNLVAGACDTALAGGVCVMAGPAMHIMTSQARMLSPDGRCFTFDQRANGFVPGEGVGVVLLKRLADAERDGDRILGVLRGWGVNQDGKTNGITAPSGDSQTGLQRDVYERYGIDPATIQLVEAHGTGTKLGDPIEVEGLCQAFSSFTDQRNYCALGSAKSNIGHLLMAAGVAGLIKTLLALQHQTLPPTIHFEQLNEHIALDDSAFYVNDRIRPWASQGATPRRAAVSSFGFSGTNAHVVVEEYATDARRSHSRAAGPFLVVLSAKQKERLREAVQRLCDHLAAHPDASIADLAYTLQVGRDAMIERVGFLVASCDDLMQQLADFLDGRASGWRQGTVGKGEQAVVDATGADEATLRAWASGARIDWSGLYPDETRPTRLSLPTYPFARERYWACAALPGGEALEGDWTLQPLSTDVDWRSRFLTAAHGLHMVFYNNVADADAFVDLLQQMAIAVGIKASVDAQCLPIQDGEVVSFEREPTTVFVLGESAPHLPIRRPQVYQLLARRTDGTDVSSQAWVRVVCGEPADGVTPLQRLFQEWLSDESVRTASRHVRYIGQQRFVRIMLEPPVVRTRPWLIDKTWIASPLNGGDTHDEVGDVVVLVNEESIVLAQRLFPRLSPNNLLHVVGLGDDVEACKAAGTRCRTRMLIDLSDLYVDPCECDADPLHKVAFYQGLIGQGTALDLLYVTKELQAFRATNMSLSGAKFAGLVKMLSAEYSHVRARGLDIDGFLYGSIETLRQVLRQELQNDLRETEICYRSGERFVPRIEACAHEETYIPSVSYVAAQGVYVVTGGTRGIGLEIAHELVDLGARKLVVMGRQSLPPTTQWEACLDDPHVDPALRDKLVGLQALRQRVEVLEIYTGALTDGQALRNFFDGVRASHGALRGVVHGAGVYSDLRTPAFVQKDLVEMQRVWEPKVKGLEQLMEVVVGDDLDFFLSFSSLTGLIPSLARGSSDYAMANAFMDFVAAFQFHQKNRRAWRTVTWVDWHDAGITARSSRAEVERLEKHLAEVGLSTFDNQQGRALFREVLHGPARPWSLLGYVDEEVFRVAQPALLLGRKSEGQSSSPQTSHLATLDDQLTSWEEQKQRGVPCSIDTLTSYISLDELRSLDDERIDRIYRLLADETAYAPSVGEGEIEGETSSGELATVVRTTLMQLLELPTVDDDEAFQNYGLDSISATIFSNRLEQVLGQPVLPHWLIDYPTVSALAQQLEAVCV